MKKHITELVVDLIRQYALVPEDSNDIDALIDLARKIATYKTGLAVEVAKAYRDKVGCEYCRRSEYDRVRKQRMDAGDSAAKAEVDAKAAVIDLLKAEFDADAEHYAQKVIMDNAGDVLDTIRQHIAQLRTEQKEVSLTTN